MVRQGSHAQTKLCPYVSHRPLVLEGFGPLNTLSTKSSSQAKPPAFWTTTTAVTRMRVRQGPGAAASRQVHVLSQVRVRGVCAGQKKLHLTNAVGNSHIEGPSTAQNYELKTKN